MFKDWHFLILLKRACLVCVAGRDFFPRRKLGVYIKRFTIPLGTLCYPQICGLQRLPLRRRNVHYECYAKKGNIYQNKVCTVGKHSQ